MPVSKAQAEEVTTAFLKEYPGALALAYYFRPTPVDLYGSYRPGVPQNFKGGYLCGEVDFNGRKYRGRVDVPLDNIDDAKDLIATLRHEVLGHYGVNTLTPSHKRALLDALILGQNEPSLKSAWATVNHQYRERTIDCRAEEVFTRQCEFLSPSQSSDSVVIAAGRQAVLDVCIRSQRKLSATDLINISAMIASKLHDRNCPQLTFPGVNDMPRANHPAGTSPTGNPSLRSLFSSPEIPAQKTGAEPAPASIYFRPKCR